jgi:maltooligosyltrehalose trehalohydrolase
VTRRRLIGAEPTRDGTSFRVWAPAHEKASLVIAGSREIPLDREPDGYFSGTVASVSAGSLYSFRLGDSEATYPDPASRFQPDGPHGPSEVIDATAYPWRDDSWRGIDAGDAVIYEMHVGTFTPKGTYAAAMDHLPYLAELGITVIELMPLSEFPGEFGWGYDGVDLWAPAHLYGRPDDLRRFIDEAHLCGIAVILDVVYNHFGPDGCFLKEFGPQYFTDRYENDWGAAVNFDGADAAGVREFFIENALFWIDEYHLDGLRFDATQSIFDRSETHILAEISRRARETSAPRILLLVAENEPQETRLIREYGIDALWNDDWHHASHVAATGRREAYYTDYRGTAGEFLAMAKHGFLYQGQRYTWQKDRRGTPSHDLQPAHFICYLQNHDQIANSADGARLHQLTSPAIFRAITTLLLLQPQTPMLFQGEEFAASAPFLYFADHKGDLARRVSAGRKEFLSQFDSLKTPEVEARLAPPEARETFERCRLDHEERDKHREVLALHRDLLAMRRKAPFANPPRDVLHGSVLDTHCLLLRWFAGHDEDRLLIVNLGADLHVDPVSDPLLAPPSGFSGWAAQWHSEAPEYGGSGMAEPENEGEWKIRGSSAVVLEPRK